MINSDKNITLIITKYKKRRLTIREIFDNLNAIELKNDQCIITNRLENSNNYLILSNTNWLTDSHIKFGLDQLKLQHNDINIVDPLIFTYEKIKLDIKPSTIIIANSNDHWITISNINELSDNWIIFDSLNLMYNNDILRKLFRNILKSLKSKTLKIDCVKVKPQMGYNDCGLYALAFAFELANKNNPAKCEFIQSQMREHYNKGVQIQNLTHFPKTNNIINELEYYTINIKI